MPGFPYPSPLRAGAHRCTGVLVPALLALLVACGGSQAQAKPSDPAQLLQVLNDARRLSCGTQASAATLLRENARLAAAAALIADGSHLDTALRAADYRSARAAGITVRGYTGPATLAREARKLCRTVNDSGLTEAGFFQRGSELQIVLAAPFTPPAATQADDVQERVLDLVNEARAHARNCGDQFFSAAPPLGLNATLNQAAAAHAIDMARYNYFSHTDREGHSVAERAGRVSYRWRAIGENIAAGQMQADSAVQGWIKSPGHCANLMSKDYTEMGLAFSVNTKSRYGVYWVQVLGTAR
ncbi:MAG: CAP domain-containing protein [Polaromonas sp.]